MLRKLFLILVAALLLGLLFTVGYAALRLGGPQEAVEEAEALHDRGEYARAIAVLELAERSASLRADRSKLQRLLRTRYESYQALGNASAALVDLEALLQTEPADAATMRADHVRLLAMTGQSERALALADDWRAVEPTDGRAHELAGEAAQTLYQEELRKVSATIARDAGRTDATRAQLELLSYLYRPDGDPLAAVALEALATMYRADSQRLAQWPTLQARLITLRGSIQAGLERFRLSLEADGEPVAAFRGLSLSLQQADRTDDVLLLCEAYRRKFKHRYVLEAGTSAVWTLLRNGQLVAAVATAERWLPESAIKSAAETQQFPSDLDAFLVGRTLAAYRIGDEPLLKRCARDAWELGKAGAAVPLAQAFAGGLAQKLNGQLESADNTLKWAMQQAIRRGTPVGQLDLMPVLVPVRLEVLQKRGASIEEITELFQSWVGSRPGELQPLLALADYQIAAGRGAAAMATCNRAQELAPFDEDLLARRVAAARLQFQGTDQDGPGLLAQCLRRGALVPEVADPVGYLLCAEAALAADDARVAPLAITSARAAGDRFPWSRRPRLLEARAERAVGRPQVAMAILDKLLEAGDTAAETLAEALLTRNAVGAPLGDVAKKALAAAGPQPAVLAAALACVPPSARAAALPTARIALALRDREPSLTPRCATIFAAAGELATADELLQACLKMPEPLPTGWLNDVATAVITRAQADTVTADTELAARIERDLADFGLRSPAAAAPLLAAAPELAVAKPRTALAVLSAALAFAAPEQRTGAAYALAGDLALRAGSFRLAEQHWTAALAFADGAVAAEPLARLCLADGREERAKQVYALHQTPRDLGLALRFGQGGQRSAAENLARERLAADRTDLLGNIAIGLLSLPSASDLKPGPQPLVDALTKCLSLLAVPELAPAAVADAGALAAALPNSATAKLLAANALVAVRRFDEAAAAHGKLFDAQVDDPLLLGEAARAARHEAYTMPPALAERLRVDVAKGRLPGCPAAAAFTLRMAMQLVEKAGNADLTQRLRTDMWVAQPVETGATVADAEALLARNQPLAAWWLLERLLPTLRGNEAARGVRCQLAAARGALAQDAKIGPMLYDSALASIATHGAEGAAVHFVLQRGDLRPAQAPKGAAKTELLISHLRRIAAYGDEDGLAFASATLLVEAAGYETARDALDAALATNPLSLPLWLAGARLAAEREGSETAIDELRAVLAASDDPVARIEFTILAARQFRLRADDVIAYVRLPQSAKATPRGLYAAGLAALRNGKPAEAAALLANAPAEADGMHLLALAEALLQAPNQDGVARAATLMAKLANDYPSSSLAKYAGSFARQLSPRAANAPASPMNR